jgi:4-amino-4-deoxy-L-arabinose transferase-like glycosyltransferase
MVPLFGAVLALLQGMNSSLHWLRFADPTPSWASATPDPDTYLIHGGLLKAPHLADTLRWWTGTWVGQVPFYRPLTSYVFWIEWKLFGDAEVAYLLPAVLAHALAAALFCQLALRLAERWQLGVPAVAGIVAGLAFVGVGLPYRWGVTSLVVGQWKNQPDALAAACCFAALLAYLRAQEGRRGRLGLAIAAYLAGCGFKEIAVFLPLVVFALELPFEKRSAREQWLRAGAFAMAGVVFLGVRWLAVGGLGFTYGTNHAWLTRTLLEVLGPFATPVTGRDWLPAAAGTWLVSVLLAVSVSAGGWAATRRQRTGLAALAAVLAGWSLLGAIRVWHDAEGQVDGWAEVLVAGLLRCFLVPTVGDLALSAVALGSLCWLCRRRPQVLWVAAAWTAGSLALLVLSPGPVHRYYLTQGGYLLVLALVAGEMIRRLWTGALQVVRSSGMAVPLRAGDEARYS